MYKTSARNLQRKRYKGDDKFVGKRPAPLPDWAGYAEHLKMLEKLHAEQEERKRLEVAEIEMKIKRKKQLDSILKARDKRRAARLAVYAKLAKGLEKEWKEWRARK